MSSTRPLRPIVGERLADLQAWFPKDRAASEPPPEDTFEIGLVLAGGQSAGCYLAGVLDFLFEALDCWAAARRADPQSVPNHRVIVKIIVGASAGGLNAALAAVAGRYRFRPAADHQAVGGEANLGSPFYKAWVVDIDIRNLLSTGDLAAADGALSLLNSDYLDGKVAEHLDFRGEGVADRDWLADPLPVRIMVSNVDGVPYQIRFNAARSPAENAASHHMSLHRDQLAFLRPLAAPPQSPTVPDHDVLSLDNSAADPSWQRLGLAGLATVAFPLALKQRVIERPSTDYEYRFAYPFAAEGLVYAAPFPGQDPAATLFTSIDGGVTDNEPFGWAHAALAGSAGRNERQGHLAKRAVILVDPFVSPRPAEAITEQTPLFALFGRIWSALVSQSRFKHIDLTLAEADDVYSRFMIGPSRPLAGGGKVRGDAALASQPLDAFLGYFSREYRHHDFMLGRRNAYEFLRDWFTLPSRHGEDGVPDDPAARGNSLFAGWPAAALANPAFRSQSPYNPGVRQIIPLLGSAAVAPGVPEWPAGRFAGFAAVRAGIEDRLALLFPILRDRVIGFGGIGRWLARVGVTLAWGLLGRRRAVAALERLIETARRQIDEAPR